MKYRMRKMPVSGKYEIYYLKDYGNGYCREHVKTCDTKEDAQQELEKLTYLAAGKTQKAPAQRMTDFLSRKTGSDTAVSSYAPGLTVTNLWEVLPSGICCALKSGLEVFSSQAKGFLTREATLIGTETRTSSPVRIVRDPETLESVSMPGLFPCGEGAGYAGGIVSAAIDGMRCAGKAASLVSRF